MKRFGLISLALVAASFASASSGLSFGASYGVYYPNSQGIRDVFGSAWQGFGFSPTSVSVRPGLTMDTDLNYLRRSRGSNDITLITGSIGLMQTYNNHKYGASTVPFVAARVGITYADYNFVVGGETSITSGTYNSTKTLLNSNLEAGVLFNNTFRLSVRWDMINGADGLNFSGYSFRATYQLVSF